jgi:hypothetical protein
VHVGGGACTGGAGEMDRTKVGVSLTALAQGLRGLRFLLRHNSSTQARRRRRRNGGNS